MKKGFSTLDYLIFAAYAFIIIFVGIWVSQKKDGKDKTSEDYFLAGKSLPWWVIGATLIGGICVQDLLPNATPDKIKSEVKRIREILGKDGGYLMAPAHNIQPDTPVENVLAFYEAAPLD